jgi:hypothetical protein
MIAVRLKRNWVGNPPGRVMYVTSGEAQLLVNNGTADYCKAAPAPTEANANAGVGRSAVRNRRSAAMR